MNFSGTKCSISQKQLVSGCYPSKQIHVFYMCLTRALEMSISSRTRDSVNPISSVSHVILTQVSTQIFACKN